MIELDSVSYTIAGKKVLSDFSLTATRGKKVILHGKSGGGKSTILRLILGFIQPDSGSVRFQGEELTDKNIWKIRQQIAYVSQDTDIGEGKVKDFFSELQSFKANRNLKRPAAFMKRFGLDNGMIDKDIEDLSGGEKQRISIVTSLMLNRKVFLLDEITSALDKRMKQKVVDFFLNSNYTVLAISHDDSWLRDDVEVVSI